MPTTSYTEEDINSFCNDVDEHLKKLNHKTMVLGDFNVEIGKRTKPMDTATDRCGFELRNERDNTLVEWAASKKYKIMNTMFQKKAGRKWTWTSPNGKNKAIYRHKGNSLQPSQHWKWPQIGYKQHQTGRRGRRGRKKDYREAIRYRC